MTCTVLVLVRTESKRLKKKALLEINQKPLIKILLDRIKNDNRNLIVCTTDKPSDDELAKYITDNNYKVFRGDEHNILFRIYSCAKMFDLKSAVIVEGDDLFCEPDLINSTCDELSIEKNQLIIWENLPFGVTPTGINLKKLETFVENNDGMKIETGWIKFLIDSKKFQIKKMKTENSVLHRPEIRLSIDYLEDFTLARKILEVSEKINLEQIIQLFDINPEWLKINHNEKKKYEENFEKQTTGE